MKNPLRAKPMKNLTARSSTGILLVMTLACLAITGCGGDKSYVSGQVTMDGEPVPNCILLFTSTDTGPGGGAIADESGNYKGAMSRNNKWLAPGEYLVEISTQADMMADDGADDEIAANAMRIPAKYRGPNSELRMMVEPGSNDVDFELTSE